MEYQGTLLDYVKHAKLRKKNGGLYTVKTLHMPEDKSYTFYTASDGLAVMSGDDLTWTLTAPDTMFCFKEFTTVGDFIDALIEYLPDNPVYTWDELADELTDATVRGNISTALGSGGVTVRGNTNTYTGTNTALASPDNFADVAAWLGAICEAASGSIRSAPISEILQTGEDGRAYRLRVVGASTITITFKLAAYDDGDAVVYNYGYEMYYSSLEDAIEDAEAGETLYLIRDYTLTENVSIPAGVTLIIPSGPALMDTSTGNNSFGRIHGGAAYVTLTIPGGKRLTVDGRLIVAGNQQAWYVDMGRRTGNYGAVCLEGYLIGDGTIYARGNVYGSGIMTIAPGSTLYALHEITDWPGGTILQNAYNLNVWRYHHWTIGGLRTKTVIMYNATMYMTCFIRASGASTSLQMPFIRADDGLFRITGPDGSIEIDWGGAGHTIKIIDAVEMRNISMTARYSLYSQKLETQGRNFPFSDKIKIDVASEGVLTIRQNPKFLPGGSITVRNGGTLHLTRITSVFLYGYNEYSPNFFNHYTYYPEIPIQDASVIVESGGTVIQDASNSEPVAVSMTQTATSNRFNWTLATDSATVTGSKGSSSLGTYAQTLTITAIDDGTITFSYNLPSNVTLRIDGTAINNAGSVSKQRYAGETITVEVYFSGSSQTVTLSGIKQTRSGMGLFLKTGTSGLFTLREYSNSGSVVTVKCTVQSV